MCCIAAALLFQMVAPAKAQTASSVDTDARAILMRMADTMATMQRFSFELRASYDSVQPSKRKIEFHEKRRFTIARPNRFRIEAEESDGTEQTLTFDGQKITVVTPDRNVYAQVEKPGTIDDAIVYFVRDLGMRLPLAMLLLNTAPQEFARRTQSVELIERTRILGTPSYHLAARTATVDYEIWIADSENPLPLRLVLTYRNAPGQPQFRAQFLDWTTAPQLTETTFSVPLPAGAQRIAFLAQMARSSGKPKRATSSGKRPGANK